jgi:hypothetical protein
VPKRRRADLAGVIADFDRALGVQAAELGMGCRVCRCRNDLAGAV